VFSPKKSVKTVAILASAFYAMMTMSPAPISVEQALDYYRQEYTNAKDNYYSEAGEVKGRWCGQLAEEWNLKGEVTSEQYERLVEGKDPHTGKQLIRSVTAREIVDENGKEKLTSTHGAGWDMTFSAPKSPSLAALVGKDERVIEGHIVSVNEALKEVEKYLQARGGGDNPAITTGKMIAVQFLHTSSRPDRKNGYAAPQLHTHVVIFNMTQCEDGKVRSVQSRQLYRTQKLATAIYRARFAEKLQALGYEILVDPRTGAPEIKGFTEAYLKDSSPRRREVLSEAEKIKERMASEGKTVSENARLKQVAARINRRSKKFDRDLMDTRALELDVRHGYQAQRLVAEARERGPLRLAQNEIEKRAQEAVTYARDNAVQKEAVTDVRKVKADALGRNLGLTTHDAVMTELNRCVERGEFINITRPDREPETTTQRMLAMEKENIQTVIDGKGKHAAIIQPERVEGIVAATAERQQRKLNTNQQTAIKAILSSTDRVLGLQGGAGTGKTTALSVVREAAEKEGYLVRGFAPTTRAAKQLKESGIQTETLQKFIRRRKEKTAPAKRLYVLDESSLASTKNLHKFFARLNPTADKVLLVGDVRQHQAVEAGRPFEQFQQHGMTTVQLSEIVRQRNLKLRKTVNDLSRRKIPEAVDQLIRRGKVIEIANEQERFEAIAKNYCQNPVGTLVVSPANRERVELNLRIHKQLQREGKVSRDDHQIKVYVNRDMTGPERTFANAYRPGEDVIRYNHTSKVYKTKPGDYAKVIETNHEKNEITVRFANGRKLIYDPKRLSGVSVYNEAERAFAEGDRVQIRAPNPAKRIVNGEFGTITKIEGERIRLTLDSKREVSLDLRQFRHLDHGYAVTSHSSQGLTFDRVLVNVDTRQSAQLVNDRMAYVAISRARHDAQIYTDSAQNLRDTLNRSTNKESALEATRDSLLDLRKELDKLRRENPLAPQQQPSTAHSLTQTPTHTAPAPTKAVELEIQGPEIEL
jgi:conjugative relaxase-like TrwC/TraI family protein